MKPVQTILISTLMVVDNETNKVCGELAVEEEIPLEDGFELTKYYPEKDAVFKLRLAFDPVGGEVSLSYPDTEEPYKCVISEAKMLVNGEIV